jgi:hypothetical protein
VTERQQKLIIDLIVSIISAVVWFAVVGYSAWLEWHDRHDRAVWILLLCIALSLCWLKSIERNTCPRRNRDA